jgi:NAD(P)-dependent dehydrogenase (short-subunit alcohol dehydrogenase family)
MRLEGKIALITGGGSGIGRATCLLAAREGANVVVADFDDVHGMETVELAKKEKGHASFVHLDVTNENDVQDAIAQTNQTYGRIDFLHNNAGGWDPKMGDTFKVSMQEWSHWIDLNLTSVFRVTRHVVEAMCARKSGSIVNTASINAFYPNPGSVAYSTAKAGVVGFTKAMALELAPFNVRVNAVCPGEIRTTIWNKTLSHLPNPKAALESLEHAIPLRRLGAAEDVAKSVVWLGSDEASYITGAILVVDGGRTVGVPVQ